MQEIVKMDEQTRKSSGIMPLVIVAAVIVVGAAVWAVVSYSPAEQASAPGGEKYSQKTPDFELKDLQGNKHKLSSYSGKNVLVMLWATWCPPCVSEIPALKALEKRSQELGLKILAVTDESAEKVQYWAKNKGISFNYTVLYDDGSLPSFYRKVTNGYVPGAIFIDPAGNVKLTHIGRMSEKEMESAVRGEK